MRTAKKTIHLNHLTENLCYIRSQVNNAKIVAVIKANAYGCGAIDCYLALDEADLFAVACIDEAIKLRKAGATKPILLLEGVFEENELSTCAKESFYISVGNQYQLDWLMRFTGEIKKIWIKFDTGMGRLGFFENEIKEVIQKLLTRYSEDKLVLMTHFADADSQNDYTERQIAQFDQIAKDYPNIEQSLANSAATLIYPNAHRDYVRPGIALYGVSPFDAHKKVNQHLKPVMTLSTKVITIKFFKKGQSIGYGQHYKMQQDGYIAICAMGYADGYLRSIPTGAPIAINQKRYTIAGRISMDMIAVLVDQSVQAGDNVECFGQFLPIEELSFFAKTIPYQLLTTVTSRPAKEVLL